MKATNQDVGQCINDSNKNEGNDMSEDDEQKLLKLFHSRLLTQNPPNTLEINTNQRTQVNEQKKDNDTDIQMTLSDYNDNDEGFDINFHPNGNDEELNQPIVSKPRKIIKSRKLYPNVKIIIKNESMPEKEKKKPKRTRIRHKLVRTGRKIPLEIRKKCVDASYKMTYDAVAKKYDVAVNSIRRWRIAGVESRRGGRKLFTDKMSQVLMKWYDTKKKGTVTNQEFRKKAYSICRTPGFTASKEWIRRFKKSNPNLELARTPLKSRKK